MTDIFENKFHKQYVGGSGEVMDTERLPQEKNGKGVTTFEEVLNEYRKYVRDPQAELPEEIRKTILSIQRTENERKN